MLELLLAQASVGDSPVSWTSVIAALSGGGFSLWYGWYTTSVTVPKMQADGNATIAKVNADNNAVITRLVADFREEMKMERQFHDNQITRLITQIDKVGCRHTPQFVPSS